MAASPPEARRSPPSSRNPFDAEAYPAIATTLSSLVGLGELLALHHVSQAYRRIVESRLADCLEIRPSVDEQKQFIALEFLVPNTKEGLKEHEQSQIRTRLGLNGWTLTLKSPEDVPPSARRTLRLVRFLTVSCRYPKATAAFVNACAHIAPHLTNLAVVRIAKAFWPLERNIPFTGKTLSLDWIMKVFWEDQDAQNVHPTLTIRRLPRFDGFERLVISAQAKQAYKSSPPTETASPSYPSRLKEVALLLGSSIERYGVLNHISEMVVPGTLPATFLLNERSTCFISFDRAPGDEDDYQALEQLSQSIKALLQGAGKNDSEVNSALSRVSIVASKKQFEARHTREILRQCRSDLSPAPSVRRKFELVHVLDTATEFAFEDLENAFLGQASPFTAQGEISLDGPLLDVALYCKDSTSGGVHVFKLPLDPASAELVYKCGVQSPFGRGPELVYDETYRSAREIKPPHMCLTGDVLAQNSVLNCIQVAMESKPLYAVMSKLNVYAEGGFFKAHRDTPRGDNHLGTLTLCLPSTFTGGELVVRHGGETAVFDWAATAGAGPNGNPPVIPWTFLYSDCEHEVLPVNSGMRVTLAYDIFVLPEIQDNNVTPHSRITNALNDVLAGPYLPSGGVLVFGLQHEYAKAPANQGSDGNMSMLSMLKGTDKAWAYAVREAGLVFEFVAVYDDRYRYEVGPDDLAYCKRRFSCSRSFFDYQNEVENDGVSVGVRNAPCGKNVHWVTKPGAWGIENSYVSYGNEPSTASIYVSVAIYAYVGPPGARTSFNAETFKEKYKF